jgi:hypothetical protein
MMGKGDRDTRNREPRRLAETIRDLIEQEGSAAKVLELHYWSQESGILEIVRAAAALPPEARDALQSFLMAVAGSSLAVSPDATGALSLRASEIAENLEFTRTPALQH